MVPLNEIMTGFPLCISTPVDPHEFRLGIFFARPPCSVLKESKLAAPDAHFYEPKKGHALQHDPFNSIVAPRPIGWISTANAQGGRNLAPYSFFNAFNYVPPIVGFASIGWKDTVANAKATGEFVWNLATRPLAQQMNATSAKLSLTNSLFPA